MSIKAPEESPTPLEEAKNKAIDHPDFIDGCPVVYYEDKPYLHIKYFAQVTHRSVQSIRSLIHKGNRCRRMHFLRDRSRLYIPLTELWGFPFIQNRNNLIFHYCHNIIAPWGEDNTPEVRNTATFYKCTVCSIRYGKAVEHQRRWGADDPSLDNMCLAAEAAEKFEDLEVSKYE